MKTLNVNGVTMAFVDRGRGTPVLFVHGFPLDHSMWDAQVKAVAQRRRATAPDLRGFGRSGPARDAMSMAGFADDLAALLDALEIAEPVVLCGLSMGGYVAFEFFRRHKKRLRGLVLCDTRAEADSEEAKANRLQTAERALGEGSAFLVETMLPKLLAPSTLESRPEIVEAVRRMVLATSAEGIAAAQRGMAARNDATALLSRIHCPTLVLVGEHDTISPPNEMRAMADKIRGARFASVSGAGHLAPMENPAEANAAISAFLADLDEGES